MGDDEFKQMEEVK